MIVCAPWLSSAGAVQLGGHVHVKESASIDYMVARNCRLRKTGQTFNKKNYGSALSAGAGTEEAK